jgi:hypothetical protein
VEDPFDGGDEKGVSNYVRGAVSEFICVEEVESRSAVREFSVKVSEVTLFSSA